MFTALNHFHSGSLARLKMNPQETKVWAWVVQLVELDFLHFILQTWFAYLVCRWQSRGPSAMGLHFCFERCAYLAT